MAERDDLNVPMIATVGAVSVILTVAIVFAVRAMYFSYANSETQRKVIEAPTVNADSRLAEQEAKLARYSWVNRAQGTVTIPIERAMELVVEEYRDQSSSFANNVSPTARRE
jgi:hypothetical protein